MELTEDAIMMPPTCMELLVKRKRVLPYVANAVAEKRY
jgi:hypothetical protein